VRGVPKTLVAALAALLLATGLAACGGGDSSSSTAAEAGAQGQSEGKSSDAAAKQGGATGKGDEGKSGSAGGEQGSGGSGASSASDFVPKHHHDSGGGSEQFKVKGGDNSVQEFGAEADTSELDAAATALHNFLDARAEGNWAAACHYMSKSVTESFEKLAAQGGAKGNTSCAATLEKLINPNAEELMKAEAAKADVGSLRIEGEHAFVIYTGAEGTVLAMPMADEGGVWKVASLAGTPLS
jgi:hypothetical protein